MKSRDQRQKVLIRASLRCDGPVREACIRDISATGLLMQAADSPSRGAYVEVVANGHTIGGRVVWASDRRFGISIQGRLNVRRVVDGYSCAGPAVSLASVAPRRLAPIAARNGALSGTHGDRLGFAFVLLFAAALITTAAVTAYQTLARPLDQAMSHLRPR